MQPGRASTVASSFFFGGLLPTAHSPTADLLLLKETYSGQDESAARSAQLAEHLRWLGIGHNYICHNYIGQARSTQLAEHLRRLGIG